VFAKPGDLARTSRRVILQAALEPVQPLLQLAVMLDQAASLPVQRARRDTASDHSPSSPAARDTDARGDSGRPIYSYLANRGAPPNAWVVVQDDGCYRFYGSGIGG
jgi:hypothetical protein